MTTKWLRLHLNGDDKNNVRSIRVYFGGADKKSVRYNEAWLCMKGKRTSCSFWHPLNGVFMLWNVHDWNSWNLSYPSLQILIASGYNVTLSSREDLIYSRKRTSRVQHNLMHRHTAHKAVIGIGALVAASQSFKPRILRHSDQRWISIDAQIKSSKAPESHSELFA